MKRLPLPPLQRHADHEVIIKLESNSKNYARYHCATCNKFVAWVSRRETNLALELGLVET